MTQVATSGGRPRAVEAGSLCSVSVRGVERQRGGGHDLSGGLLLLGDTTLAADEEDWVPSHASEILLPHTCSRGTSRSAVTRAATVCS